VSDAPILVQVGKATWVNPDSIQAIEWSGYYECPKILLGGQHYVNATFFKDLASAETPNNAEACTDALTKRLGEAWQIRSGQS
jgi:hypothetical protein